MEKFVTKISWDDFQKLNLVGYRHVYENGHSCFVAVDLNNEVRKQFPMVMGAEYIVVAIHREPNEAIVEYLMKEGNMSAEDAMDMALYNECYTVPGMGFQTFMIKKVQNSLKSTRDYFENEEIKVNKRVSKAVYEIY